MWRLRRPGRRERGAVAVVVAIWMVVAMGFVAISVDVGSIYSDSKQLQNGADAGALAIAESCQRGHCVDTADAYAKSNKLDGVATGTIAAGTDYSTGVVVVQTTAVHKNWFAGILGMATTPLNAKAKATWGYPSGGATLPITFSWCAFDRATGGWYADGTPVNPAPAVIHVVESACTPPAHNEVAGGFGYISGTNCVSQVLSGTWVTSDPGNNGPNSCAAFNWASIQNTTVLVPIFDNSQGTGSNAQYHIMGLAAFYITGICFSSQSQVPSNMPNCPSDKRIEGHFVNYSVLGGNYTTDPNAVKFGLGTVTLAG